MEATPPLCHQGRSDRGANGEGLLVRLHKYVVLVGLAMLLYLANFLVGCEKEQSPSVYYGPPPADWDAAGSDVIDASALPPADSGNGEPVVYYGPQPFDAGGVDVATDAAPADVDQANDIPMVFYGPAVSDGGGVDAATDAVPADIDQASDMPMVYYGPPPMDISPSDAGPAADCAPVAVYGPLPCGSDHECVESEGVGWYCDKDNTFSDGCGGEITWPVCKEQCQPVSVYGPQPCDTDDECVESYGPGWYCDKDNTYDDGCGGEITWPVCTQDGI